MEHDENFKTDLKFIKQIENNHLDSTSLFGYHLVMEKIIPYYLFHTI